MFQQTTPDGYLIFLYICLRSLWILAAVFLLRRMLHLLQLSSYQLQGYFRSLRQNFLRECLIPLLQFALFLLFSLAAAYLQIYAMAGFVVLMVATLIHYRPRKEKKPFVVTPRIRRLIFTIIAMIALWALLTGLVHFGFDVQMLAGTGYALAPFAGWGLHLLGARVWIFVLIFAPLLTAAASLINGPLEKRINDGFIRDAQRILGEQPRLRIIGVTGSFGKTSVKYYLTTLLSEQYNVLMTPESYNTPMGIVRTIREQMKPTHEIFVCEMGARHVHDIREITDFVHPDDGILTAIGEQHLETFHTLDNIIATKYELLDAVEEKHPAGEALSPEGRKIVNGDDENIRAHMKYPDALTYGLKEGNDFRARDIRVTPAGTAFKVQLSERAARQLALPVIDSTHRPSSGGEVSAKGEGDISSAGIEFTTSLVGAHNVQNIMGAIALATLYGVPASKLRRAVRRIEGVPHRLELKRHGNVTILDDAYNANPAGAKTALETLGYFRDQTKILVTPGMVELGAREKEYNEAFGAQAAEVCDYIILVGEKRTAPIAEGIRGKGFDEARLFIKKTFDEAAALMYEIDAGKEKVILLENDLPDNY